MEQPASSLPVIDGKYQLLRLLGEGGMGAVYEARHMGTGRRVAVKVIATESLSKSGEVISRFQREAMATGTIESQYIAHVLDTGVDPSSHKPYMVMELLVGEDVEQAVKRLGPLPPELALKIAAQACLGLQKAHESGVVHRDIKPANLYLTRRDGGEIVLKILDFGIAKMKVDTISSGEGKSLTRTGTMLGSPLYMSPEQAYGKKTLDHRTDVWSIGVVLYEALSGSTPHGDSNTVGELIVRICQHPPRVIQELAPWLAPEVAEVVHRALALDPDARFASASAMYSAIRALLPQGHGLDESMFVPLSAQQRSFVATQMSVSPEFRATAASLPDMQPQRAASPAATGGSRTTGGLGRTGVDVDDPVVVPRRSGAVWVAVGTVVAAGVIGGAVFLTRGHGTGAATGEAPSAAATVVPPPAAPSASVVALAPEASSPPAAPSASAVASAAIGTSPNAGGGPVVRPPRTQPVSQKKPPPAAGPTPAPAPAPAPIDPGSIR